jgi:formylmethanofuran dehydrogenase subunit C
VSDVITLTLRGALEAAVEFDGLAADRFTTLTASEIGALPAWAGARRAQLGDFFDVRGERSDRVRVEGCSALVHGLGAGMRGGELTIAGDVGRALGEGMSGGSIEVLGSTGDGAGVAMSGGTIRIRGNAGDRLGAASAGAAKGMTGGELVVGGHAGREAGARARRGLIVIGGDAGNATGRSMIAGTVVVFGHTGADAGLGNKRGSIVAIGGIDIPATYRLACTFQPPHVRLTMTYLRRRYGLNVPDEVLDGHYRRYCGDLTPPGKGEILEWAQPD